MRLLVTCTSITSSSRNSNIRRRRIINSICTNSIKQLRPGLNTDAVFLGQLLVHPLGLLFSDSLDLLNKFLHNFDHSLGHSVTTTEIEVTALLEEDAVEQILLMLNNILDVHFPGRLTVKNLGNLHPLWKRPRKRHCKLLQPVAVGWCRYRCSPGPYSSTQRRGWRVRRQRPGPWPGRPIFPRRSP